MTAFSSLMTKTGDAPTCTAASSGKPIVQANHTWLLHAVYMNFASFKVCLQCREKRLAFYRQHDIGFVARPPHGKAGFVRAGRFKKASNMNYSLEVSRQVENIMQALIFSHS